MNQQLNAGVAELADTSDLSSDAVWREGSSPFSCTTNSHVFDLKIIC